MREEPRTSAERIVKVPLGALVTQCRQHGKEWVYAVYEGKGGYIQDRYVRLCEGTDVYSAMLVTDCGEGADYYETVGSLAPDGFIPADTLVRNCAVLARGRAYVEYAGRGVYVDAEFVRPYNELSHYPLTVTMYCKNGGYDGAYEGMAPALQVSYTEDFDLSAYAYTEYDDTAFEPAEEDYPRVKFVLHADTAVERLHLFSVSLRSIDGDAVIDATLEHMQAQLLPEHPLAVTAVMYGDMPNLAVGYEDWTGAYHFAFIEISGEDGSIYLNAF